MNRESIPNQITERTPVVLPRGAQVNVSKTEPAPTTAFVPTTELARRVVAQLEDLNATVQRAAAADLCTSLQAASQVQAATQTQSAGEIQAPGDPMRLPTAPPASSAPAAESEDEHLESYLRQYMEQLTGKKKAHESTTTSSPSPTPTEPVPALRAAPRQPAAPPENWQKISAMRELANDSARSQLAESVQIERVISTRAVFLATKAISLVSSTLAFAYILTQSPAALFAAELLLGVALILACRFFILCRTLAISES